MSSLPSDSISSSPSQERRQENVSSPPSRTTLTQLAKRAGVHHTTVSRALRSHPGIPLATRDRIKALAEEMGYRPDPFLSALASYRQNVRGMRYQATLAWVMPYETRQALESHRILPEYLRGASKRAEELGYGMDEVWMQDFGMNGRKVSAVLKARGIVGLIIPPQMRHHAHLKLEWNYFSAVSFGFTLTRPNLHRVANDQYGSMFKLTRHLLSKGFDNPCLVIPAAKDERVRCAWSAGFRSAMENAGRWRPESLLKPQQYESRSLLKWLDAANPDVLIALDPHTILPMLEKEGIAIPRDLSLAGVALPANEPYFGGITESGEVMGATAVEILSGLLNRGEVGLPSQPRCTMIEGAYHAGPSIAKPNTPRMQKPTKGSQENEETA